MPVLNKLSLSRKGSNFDQDQRADRISIAENKILLLYPRVEVKELFKFNRDTSLCAHVRGKKSRNHIYGLIRKQETMPLNISYKDLLPLKSREMAKTAFRKKYRVILKKNK